MKNLIILSFGNLWHFFYFWDGFLEHISKSFLLHSAIMLFLETYTNIVTNSRVNEMSIFWLSFSRFCCFWLDCHCSCHHAGPAGYFSLEKSEAPLHCLLSMLFLFGAKCSGFWSIFELILGWFLMIFKAAFKFIHLGFVCLMKSH